MEYRETMPLRVVLYQPEIPQNTGNIARTCAATRIPLHLIKPLGFHLTDRYLKRAGLDYWPYVNLNVHEDLGDFRKSVGYCREIYLSTHAKHIFYEFGFQPGDVLIFGSETRGLPRELTCRPGAVSLRIPIDHGRVRSLNLATSVGVVVFEAIRQMLFEWNIKPAWLSIDAGRKVLHPTVGRRTGEKREHGST